MIESGCPQRELAVGWALHCLEPDEEEMFTAHLAGCRECCRTVAETQSVGAALASALPEFEPPPELGARIIAAAQNPQVTTAAVPHRVDTAPVDFAQYRPRRLAKVGLTAAAVALVALSVGLGIHVVQLDNDRDDLVAQREATSAVIEEILDGAADPGVTRVAFAAADGAPMAVMFGTGSQMTLVPVHIPANHPERDTYVLWGLGTGSAQALGVFDVDDDDGRLLPVRLDPQTGAFTGFAVSLEPGRTAPVSPSSIMASGTVES